MKFNRVIKIFLVISLFAMLGACSKIKKTDAEIEREQWIAGFTDSVVYYQQRSTQLDSQLEMINSQIASMINDFEYIKNPREVTGYYLLKGWSKKIPFTTTGIYARVNENEKLELIATLRGATFNKISVGDFTSETVPHDQAFNFRHQRFNTVYFTGGKADTIAEYIAGHEIEKVNLEFLEGSKKINFTIPKDEKEMVGKTWNLYSLKREALKLQKEIWLNSRKIETFRRIMDENALSPDNSKE